MRKEPIVTGEYYHVFSRGVDRRATYRNDSDRERFLWGMIAFNDVRKRDVRLSRYRSTPTRNTSPLVQILCYAFMPNHYHFLLKQIVDGGIALFMQRLGAGYTSYFNRQNGRTGCLWESEYKAVRIETDAQLLHVSRYIHLNPLKLFFPDWKTCGVQSWEAANAALVSYTWSSYRHFLGFERNNAVNAQLLFDMFEGSRDYQRFLQSWVMPTAAPEARPVTIRHTPFLPRRKPTLRVIRSPTLLLGLAPMREHAAPRNKHIIQSAPLPRMPSCVPSTVGSSSASGRCPTFLLRSLLPC